jgi:low temperature requirement protein LtrA
LEVLWLARLGLGDRAASATFLTLVVLELMIPVWAERAGPTSWHPHHIAERYSLFTIILLGESILAATSAVVAVFEKAAGLDLAVVAACSLVTVAALWWLCFAVPAGAGLQARRYWSFVWGYGYYLAFAGLAALGAGLEVVVAARAGHADHLTTPAAVASVAVPVAVVIVVVELLRLPLADAGARFPARAVAVLAALSLAVVASARVGLTTGVCLVALVVTGAVAADTASTTEPRSSRRRRS